MTADWQRQIDAAVDELAEQMVGAAAAFACASRAERRGAEDQPALYQLFDELGLAGADGPEGCGVVVDSRDKMAPRRIAVRADIDALRIQDQKQAPYRSTVPEVMHACGHDAHTATVFGALAALDRLECEKALPWPVTWRGIFQPAEETSDGARAMVAAGALERRRRDRFAARRSDAAGRHDRRAARRVHRQLRCDARDGARPRRPRGSAARVERPDRRGGPADQHAVSVRAARDRQPGRRRRVLRADSRRAECQRDSRTSRARRHGPHARPQRAGANDRPHPHAGRRHRASHRHASSTCRFESGTPVGLQ